MALTSQRLDGIDTLRGAAAILVVLHHIHLRFVIQGFDVRSLLPEFLSSIVFRSGHYAVIAFFVISGFLITRLSLRRWGMLEHIQILQFYRLRLARIMPGLLLLLVVLSALHLLSFADYMIKPERATLSRALIAALTFHVNWLEGSRGYLPGNWDVLWSLSVEETFYALFPLVCLCLKRKELLFLSLLALIVIGPFNRMALDGQKPWDEYSYLSCMDGIAFGCLAGWMSVSVPMTRRITNTAMTVGVAAIVLIVVFRKHAVDLGLTQFGLNLTVLEFGMALLLLALSNGAGSFLVHRSTSFLRFAGRCSYEIYLTHMFVVFSSMHVFKAVFDAAPTAKLPYLSTYAAVLGLSIMLGYAVERGYSKPMNNKLRERWRIEPRAAQLA